MSLSPFTFFLPRLRRLAFDSGLTDRMAHQRRGVRILMHHGIGTADYSAAAFDEQLAWLKATHVILKFSEVVDHLRQGTPLPDFAVVITFDDGLRNNFTEAYPLLLKHQVPATFFICPGLVDNGGWIWTYEVRERLNSLAAEDIAPLALQICGEATPSISQIVGWMKKQPNEGRKHATELIRMASSRFQPTENHHRAYDPMSWDELHSLDQRLITLGSHTMDHPILSSLTETEVEAELRSSKEALEAHGLISEPPLLCYPDGGHNERVIALARRYYAAACGTSKGMVTASSPLFALPRIGGNSRVEDVAWRLWRPGA